MTNPFEEFSELLTIDLNSGKTKNPAQIPWKDCKALAISPSGNRIATIKDGRGAEPGRLDFWNIESKKITQQAAWKTAGFHDRDGFSPSRAIMLDERRLLTLGKQVALWDCDTAKAFYSYRCDGAVATSANHQWVAAVTGNIVWITNAENGEAVSSIDTGPSSVGGVTFSPSGNFLASYRHGGEILVWDLTDGELIQTISSPGGTASSIEWATDKYLLVNDRDLMDIELRASVWQYQITGGSLISGGDGRFWLASKTRLTPVSLPHRDVSKQTAELNPDDLLILKSGVQVAVELQLPFPPDEQKKIRDHLVTGLESMGVEITDSAELKLVASVKAEESETAELSGFHDPFGRRGTETVTFTPHTSTLILSRNEKPLWQATTRNSMVGILHPNEGESTQAAATRVSQPKPEFFSNVQLPTHLASLPDGKQLGTSRITDAGIQ